MEWEWEYEPIDDLSVVCARCGKAGTSVTFIIEEGDEWECPKCWARCEAQELAIAKAKP